MDDYNFAMLHSKCQNLLDRRHYLYIWWWNLLRNFTVRWYVLHVFFSSTQSTPRIVQSTQTIHSSNQQQQHHSNGHGSSQHGSTRQQRKNVISCVTVADSDGEASPGRAHAHLYQHLPHQQHPQPQHTTQHIKHEPQPQHHVRFVIGV